MKRSGVFIPNTNNVPPNTTAIINGEEVDFKVADRSREKYEGVEAPNGPLTYLGEGEIDKIGGAPQKNQQTQHFWK